uniref:(California timema) hypothetical protein n=1 Tax=Timema californicum TaxID=61474 RepID=A0A7R9J6G9_TIMCA|nr:unnamed protein product [Timema californicum]
MASLVLTDNSQLTSESQNLGGFYHNYDEEQHESVEEIVPAVDNWEDLGPGVEVPYEDLVNLDESLSIYGGLTDTKMLSDVMDQRNDSASSDGEGEQTELPEKMIPTSKEVMDHIEDLRRFIEDHHNRVRTSLPLCRDVAESPPTFPARAHSIVVGSGPPGYEGPSTLCVWSGTPHATSARREGGRLERELHYTETALGEADTSTHQLVIQAPKDPGASLLHPAALLTHLQVLRAATAVTVHLFDMTVDTPKFSLQLNFTQPVITMFTPRDQPDRRK